MTPPPTTPADAPRRASAAHSTMGKDGASARKSGESNRFVFEDVSFTVSQKGGAEKHIVQGISSSLHSGSVLAILGPSGAGKTTLINCLTLNAHGGVTRGRITLNGETLTPAMLRSRCFVVQQQDNHWPGLTCTETLQYAADLYMTVSDEEKAERVSSVIAKMGLESCATTRVGNEFLPGMSGGQKRRLSIAIALIKQPDLMFLDEPTSGLDAAAAANVMTYIKRLAEQEQLIIVATIHQPSSKIFHSFDKLMILSKGRPAYTGPAASAISYFNGIGHSIKTTDNPAEYFLDIVNSDFADEAAVERVLTAWEEAPADEDLGIKTSDIDVQISDGGGSGRASAGSATGGSDYQTDTWTQVTVLLKRQSQIALRDPLLFLGRCVIFLLSNVYFSLVYLEMRPRDQDQVLSRFWLMVWHYAVPANMGVVAVFAYNATFKAIRREVKNGMVSPSAYLFATMLMEIPIMFCFALFSIGIPAYGISNYWGERFGIALIIFASGMFAWEGFAHYFAVAFDNPLLGMTQYVSIWFSGFLFSGFLIEKDQIPWPFRVLVWVLPMRYGVRGLLYNEFIDTTYEECATGPDGTVCTSGQICYGNPFEPARQEGGDVLNTLGEVIFLASDKNTLLEDITVLLGIGVVMRVLYMVTMQQLVKKASSVETVHVGHR